MPEWKEEIANRLAKLKLAPAREAEITEELAQHLDDRYLELVAGGTAEDEARRVAIEELKDENLLAKGLRAVEQEMPREPVVLGGSAGHNFLSSLWQDIRYGLRQLQRNPGLTAVAVITLALGIGLNTIIFSMVDALLLRPLPVSHPKQIYTLATEGKQGGHSNGFSYEDLQEIWKQTSAIFSNVAGVQVFGATGLSVDGKNEPMWTNFVTGNFFDMLGVRPALGRFILPGEGRVAGTDPVLVLGYSFWKDRLGGDPNVVGKSASVNGRPVTIVGVAPKGFRPVSTFLDTQGYMPLGMAIVGSQMKSNFLTDRQAKNLVLIARVRPGVSDKEIQASCGLAAKRLAAEYPKADSWRALSAFPLSPFGPDPRPDSSLAVISALFLALAWAVLMVACLNVTNILLARMNVRRGEIAVRTALGATRGRLVRHLLTESFLLALFACAGGVGLGFAGNRLLGSLSLHTSMPVVTDFHYDWRVFGYALAVAVLSGAIAGIAPALRATGGNLNEVLHGSRRTAAAGGHRFGKGLVVSQVAGSLMLLLIAGLFVRSLFNVQHSDLGFNPRHILNITIDPHFAGYSETRADEFLATVLGRVSGLPGIQSASFVATVPMGNVHLGEFLEIPGLASSGGSEIPYAGYNVVSSGYFETMQIPLLRGRDFRESDDKSSPRVAVINQAMAERFWPGKDPIGEQFRLKGDLDHPLEIVGVVANSRTAYLFGSEGPYFYMALAQKRMLPVTLQVRTAGNPELMAPVIARGVRSLAPAMPLEDVQTMREALNTMNGLFLFELGAGLAAAMGILGLILAIVGLFGVVSYTTAQRTHEIGVRLALGAQPGEILRMVLRQGMFIVAVGSVVGILMAAGLAQLAGHFLVGVSPTDPVTFIAVSLILINVALLACYIPARRAAKVDPIVALRYE
jgi:putative ABC transport system permease protein